MDYKLYQGDCLEVMDRLIAEGIKVDAVITDPPYGTTDCKWDSVIPFDKMWERLKQLRKDNAATILFGSEPFSSALRMSNIKEFKHDWIWDKHIPRGFQVARYRPMSKLEIISIFGKGKINYYPILVERDKPVKVKNYANKNNVSSNNIKHNDSSKEFIYTHKTPDNLIVGLWEANAGKVHPTQKPVKLMEYLIKTYTNEGDTVLDFTMGSGTTGVACVNTNRNFIGIELDETYFKIAENRIAEAVANASV